ncbi:MAG: hypothetical protein ACLQD9_03555 [Thermoplasmata archaeon]
MTADAEHKARYQLGRILLLLGALGLTVLVFVLTLALGRGRWGLPNVELFVAIAIGALVIILARIFLAVRLRAHGGNLS